MCTSRIKKNFSEIEKPCDMAFSILDSMTDIDGEIPEKADWMEAAEEYGIARGTASTRYHAYKRLIAMKK